MVKVIGVRFRTAGKIYFFDPGKLKINRNDHVIVETARGIEYGTVVGSPREVPPDKVIQLPSVMMSRKPTTKRRKRKHLRFVLRRLKSMVLR